MTIDPRSPAYDPTALLAAVADATAQLLGSAERLDDQAVREPSALPDWTRGHVLTHVARNADGLSRLLTWAVTGERHDAYASREARDAQIEAGASRTAAELVADVREAGERFAEAASRLTPQQWSAKIERPSGGPQPAAKVPWWRLEEVLVHHVDLDMGFSPAHWPADFTGPELEMVAERFADPAYPTHVPTPFRVYAEDTARAVGVGCDPAEKDHLLVRGPQPALVAWLIGRSSGDGLAVEPFDALPTLPIWN
ncbi:maleylpyruvate isomerase N-terminal domain-containing protein [Actinocrinis puniceicyclus]|uniref:Maleylpyruvate isomerase N-terminal domain-containing protein n=1 Tax=Actinocrinis puniceicyclus TaxID=977794 RepID=A0A8J7WWK4_9ACTN|nr:maleylpyruvate isomerase N-terminal domain-containing protein [Actinocrinis puniceicyclus]MBS2966424.1 maleylpyruvate isomerase N-terminal domain-containing protein [Actinocrinis puniceicyclus]